MSRRTVFFRLLRLAIPFWRWMALSVLLGFLTIASSIGLMATSAWVIAHAALRPSIADLQVAIVGVRAFGIARGLLRYLERLVSHEATFRLLTQIRTWFYRALEPLAPARLMQYRSGDLLARIVADVDTLENFYIRAIAPPLVAVLTAALMVVFVVRFRYRKGQTQPKTTSHSTKLEITWTIIPTIIVIIIFALGHRAYQRMTVAPPNIADQIDVTASMWNWQFTYQPSGFQSNELHLPLDVPVRLVLRSNDVIHGFYIPQFRIKKDVVPGRANEIWVRATEEGEFDLYCSQYCGTQHSAMLAKVVVHVPEEYQAWLAEQRRLEANMDPVARGRKLYFSKGCAQCHSLDGSRMVGPSFKDLYGIEEQFTDGSRAIVDDDFIRQFVRNPTQRIPVGYAPGMSPFDTTMLPEEDVSRIILFMKSISVHYKGPPLDATTQPTTRPSGADGVLKHTLQNATTHPMAQPSTRPGE
jgi:cytochrome c oxidase subunit 2